MHKCPCLCPKNFSPFLFWSTAAIYSLIISWFADSSLLREMVHQTAHCNQCHWHVWNYRFWRYKSKEENKTIVYRKISGNSAHQTKAQFVRLAFDTEPRDVYHLLSKVWKLPAPKLVITIHGGLTNFEWVSIFIRLLQLCTLNISISSSKKWNFSITTFEFKMWLKVTSMKLSWIVMILFANNL